MTSSFLESPLIHMSFSVIFSSVYNLFALLGRKATFTHSLIHMLANMDELSFESTL